MLCIFCGTPFHLSQNCNIYIHDETRLAILAHKGYCKLCFNIHENNEETLNNICRPNTKCYICLSKCHHSVPCPFRNLVPTNLFFPNINQNMFQRFSQMFNPLERFLLIFSSKTSLSFIHLKTINIHDRVLYSNRNSRNFYGLFQEIPNVELKNVNVENILKNTIEEETKNALGEEEDKCVVLSYQYFSQTTKTLFQNALTLKAIAEVDFFEKTESVIVFKETSDEINIIVITPGFAKSF